LAGFKRAGHAPITLGFIKPQNFTGALTLRQFKAAPVSTIDSVCSLSIKSNMAHFNEGEKSDVEVLDSVAVYQAQVRRKYAPRNEEEMPLDRKVNLKLDLTVIPLLTFGFLLQGIDKSNIGNAATSPGKYNSLLRKIFLELTREKAFIKDVHVGKDDVSNSVSLFSATFITLMPLSVAAGRYFGPKYWLPFIMLCWGGITMAQSAMRSNGTIIALRLLLGACEAAYILLCYYYISLLYPRYIAGFRIGLYAGISLISAAFSSSIAYRIL
jgi:hypothetical protein